MTHLKLHSLDKVAANIDAIAALFPNAVTEVLRDGKTERAIDFDVLRQELSDSIVEGREERYQFTWPDKRKAVLAANAPITSTLRPVVADSVGKDGTPGGFDSENLYIEGDNLEVLKLLQETYLGKVKMIYIDPPYNTGNDFVYEDDFAKSAAEYLAGSGQYDEAGNRMVTNTESNGRFHTDWLNMIYPRLKLAKDLLSEDGVIFISIDDNEQENLKKCCDETLGSTNFVAQLVWEKKKKGSFLSRAITNVKEYVLVYCKNIGTFAGLIGEINRDTETYPCINAGNKRELRTIPAGIESKYKELNYFLPKGTEISDTTMSIILHSDLVIKDGSLAQDLILEGNWRYSQEAMRQYAERKEIYITRDLYLRRIVTEARSKTMKDLLPRVGDDEDTSVKMIVDLNNLSKSGWGSNEDADEELRLLFGIQKMLDYPKPVRLIKKLIASYRNMKDSICMDFFSGSATTAHAVMQLNAEDGGHRKFILVQLPEKTDEKSEAFKAGYPNICEIGKERIRRAGKKIREEAGEAAALQDFGFRCLRLDSSNMEDVYYEPEKLGQQDLFTQVDNVKQGRTAEDLLFQVMLDMGIPLSSKISERDIAGKKVFDVGDGFLLACFDSAVTEAVVTEIAKQKPQYAVLRDSSMANDSVATNFEQIFASYSPETERKVL